MTCPKCNGAINSGENFCGTCGTSLAVSQPEATASSLAQDSVPQQYPPHAAAVDLKKKNASNNFIVIAAVVTTFVVAIMILVAILVDNVTLMPVQRAMTNFNEEVAWRAERTPFQAFVIMNEIYQDGAATLNFDFNYRSGIIWNPDMSGSFTVASDSRTLEWATFGEVRVMGMPIDITAVMDRERLAVQSNVIDRDNFYGITFATFAQDMQQFGNMLGMSQREIDDIVVIVRMIESIMDVQDVMDEWGDIQTDILTTFFVSLESSSENTEITVGGESVSVSRVEFVVTREDLIGLLHDFLDAAEIEPAMRTVFEQNAMVMDLPDFDQAMRELRDGLRDIEFTFDADIRFSLYIGRGDRLIQARLDANTSFDGELTSSRVFLDLGSSVNDTWYMTVEWSDSFGGDSFTASWDFNQIGQNYVNSIRFFDLTMESSWNPDSGRFDLSVSDGPWTESFGGSFNVSNDGGFGLQLDRINIGGDTLDLSLSVSPGAYIPRVDFINIDRWDLSLIDLIGRSILGMLW